jgi:hypothetical protein
MQSSFRRGRFSLGILLVLAGSLSRPVGSAEPAREFLERLREEGMFDLATRYLEIYDANNWLPASMKPDVKLERLMIMQDALAASRTSKELDARLAALESGFKDFYDSSKGHPRRSEAGLRLGSMSMDRGQRQLKKLADLSDKQAADAARKAAQQAFQQAEAIFKSTQDDLAEIIKQMAGAKVAADDLAKIALRKQYQGEYRQAQILQGLSLKLLATSYPENSNEYKAGLQQAEEKLKEVINKATSSAEIGAKTLSRLYRGDVLALQGKAAEALESYIPVADLDQDGIFRLWRVQATAAMVRLLGSTAGGNKFDEAIKRGQDLLKVISKNEQANPEWLDLQLAVAQARLTYSQELAKKKGNETQSKGERREARELLQNIARRPGDHQASAKKLLSELGIEVADPGESRIPQAKTFAEAFSEAKIRIDRAESSQLSRELLNTRLAEAAEAEKPPIEAELKSIEENANRDRQQALALLQRSFQLFRDGDSREDLLNARFYVAYLYIRQNHFWESAAASDFVARSGPGTDLGLKACGFALFSFRKLIEGLPAEGQTGVMHSLESLAKYMIATWPEAEETQQATLTLLQNALQQQQWDDAERYLTLLPRAADQSNATRRDLGYVLWIQYLLSQDAERKAGNNQATGDLQLRDRAERLLHEGWESLDVTGLNQRAVEAAAALASLYLRTDRRQEAESILNQEKVGPLAVIQSGAVQDPAVKLEVLRLSLQAKVMGASAGESTLDPNEVEKIVKSMQATAQGNEKLLTNTLLALAKDLREQLDRVESPADQAKLAGGIRVLLTQLAEVSDNAGILDWAGTTLWQLANGLATKPGNNNMAVQLNQGAAKVFEKILAKNQADPSYLDAIERKPDDILIKQALALRGQESFEEATTIFVQLLSKNNSQLTAQVEAARTFQQWSENKDVALLKKAAYGAEPDTKQKNIVWGWGQMSKMLSSQLGNRPDLQGIFFDARLQLATCRRLIAMNLPAGPERQKVLEQAMGDIRQTYFAYPELGGPERLKEFDRLLKTLQADLGKPANGLQEFKTEPTS